MNKKYVFKPYSSSFPELFEKEKQRIASQIKGVSIEHIGSTAIPNLGGKGIIDIAVATKSEQIPIVSEQIQSLGYEFRPHWSTPERLYFKLTLPDSEEGTRSYHLHLMFLEAKEWKEMLVFRDYLRSHPKEAQEYAELKQKAVQEADEDGAKYRKLKGPIFKKILNKIFS